jgi:protein-S-isoprenylcysteine O-methyltransferase Ste14
MKASSWEFSNRAMVFGLIIGFSFSFYFVDPVNVTAALAGCCEAHGYANGGALARALFFLAAGVLGLAALIRTWASAYLHSGVVYAAEVKSASLVADGPYRQVRNPLYFANVLMAIALGALMSRVGFFAVVIAMTVFCYRLILREESELRAAQGAGYEAYCKAVPRLWPSPWPHIPTSGQAANWSNGFKAECWYWGFALAILAFAITLKLLPFFVILGASFVLFWVLSSAMARKASASG